MLDLIKSFCNFFNKKSYRLMKTKHSIRATNGEMFFQNEIVRVKNNPVKFDEIYSLYDNKRCLVAPFELKPLDEN